MVGHHVLIEVFKIGYGLLVRGSAALNELPVAAKSNQVFTIEVVELGFINVFVPLRSVPKKVLLPEDLDVVSVSEAFWGFLISDIFSRAVPVYSSIGSIHIIEVIWGFGIYVTCIVVIMVIVSVVISSFVNQFTFPIVTIFIHNVPTGIENVSHKLILTVVAASGHTANVESRVEHIDSVFSGGKPIIDVEVHHDAESVSER